MPAPPIHSQSKISSGVKHPTEAAPLRSLASAARPDPAGHLDAAAAAGMGHQPATMQAAGAAVELAAASAQPDDPIRNIDDYQTEIVTLISLFSFAKGKPVGDDDGAHAKPAGDGKKGGDQPRAFDGKLADLWGDSDQPSQSDRIDRVFEDLSRVNGVDMSVDELKARLARVRAFANHALKVVDPWSAQARPATREQLHTVAMLANSSESLGPLAQRAKDVIVRHYTQGRDELVDALRDFAVERLPTAGAADKAGDFGLLMESDMAYLVGAHLKDLDDLKQANAQGATSWGPLMEQLAVSIRRRHPHCFSDKVQRSAATEVFDRQRFVAEAELVGALAQASELHKTFVAPPLLRQGGSIESLNFPSTPAGMKEICDVMLADATGSQKPSVTPLLANFDHWVLLVAFPGEQGSKGYFLIFDSNAQPDGACAGRKLHEWVQQAGHNAHLLAKDLQTFGAPNGCGPLCLAAVFSACSPHPQAAAPDRKAVDLEAVKARMEQFSNWFAECKPPLRSRFMQGWRAQLLRSPSQDPAVGVIAAAGAEPVATARMADVSDAARGEERRDGRVVPMDKATRESMQREFQRELSEGLLDL